MQVLTTYNSITSGFDIPLSEVFMSPTGTTGISDDFRLLTEWDARTSVASGATAVLTADSFGGEVTITGVSAGGGHLELKTAAFAAAAGKPVFMLSRVKVTTAGQYFIGLTQKVAANSAVSSATQIVAGSGAGFVINTDNKADLVTRDNTGTPINVVVADQFTIVAGTYYLFGVALYTNVAEFFINGKKVGQAALTGGLSGNVCPSFECNTNAKVMTIDLCSVAQER